MSDEEFMMEDTLDDEEDYDFEYEDDEEEEDADAQIENKYYNAKSIKTTQPEQALYEFQEIVEQENSKSEWGFKALKQQAKIQSLAGKYEEALGAYRSLFSYMHAGVTQNYAEKSINSLLDFVSASSVVPLDYLQAFYDIPKELAPSSIYDRIKVKLKLKLARSWLSRCAWSRLEKTLQSLRAIEFGDGKYNSQGQGTTLLELLSMEIQMYDKMGKADMVKKSYETALGIDNAIPHPCTIAIIREYGGKMHMAEKNWQAAQVDFFQAFNNYDEAGSPQRVVVLKYLVLAHILMGNGINPFDSQETKPYKDDVEMAPLVALLSAYECRDVHKAVAIVNESRDTLMKDDFIRIHLPDVLHELRVQYIQEYVKPYRSVRLERLAHELQQSAQEIESLLVTLILDQRIRGQIDQVAQSLELHHIDHSTAYLLRRALIQGSTEIAHMNQAISRSEANRGVML
ncbi:Similar to S.cerevisiae protein RPN6 (Essential, non-ATPase regulatory subunit of the 26S proteasome lid) [Malassezia sympodialis ATCC 42132]|uniref:Similar to S.cerevisiae protein RPN6 (Essential, non-ATPase regulatory subunit of the 26S proteasome lid) n=1 Tax=Malassezia sympodialis (strain ATCC 42132) TaxID=1230383 RepID=A0A1M8A8M0_MALS4|nr:Similar to S.cerevisiae protein RPN6 (Essential, non-ATPase regulatory subunit of the 26S proteasome lid) [Malassezia sympodialis ATCC 42132]